MGILKTAATAVSALGSVAGGVFNVVKGVGTVGASILKSGIGKFAIASGAAMVLCSDPINSGQSLLSKIAGGFKSFIGNIGASISSKASSTALTAAAAVSGVGQNVSVAMETVAADDTHTMSLRDVVIESSFADPVSNVQSSQPAPVTAVQADAPAEAAPAVEPELC